MIKSAAVCCQELPRLADFGQQGYAVDNSLLPAAIRRRTALTTKMAVTAGINACRLAAVDSAALASVFASVGGEIQVTDALCKTLPERDALLSPTQFHNSVHNTTAGYWSIINGCRAPTTAIAAGEDTFAMSLIEAWSQLQRATGDLLLVCYDETWPQYLAPPMGKTAFSCALVLSNSDGAGYSISLPETSTGQIPVAKDLLEFIRCAPAAAVLPLLQAMSEGQSDCRIPLNFNGIRWVTQLHKKQEAER